MSIALSRNVESYFHEAVGTAMRTRKVDATDSATSYLVALLADFAHPDAAVGETLTRPLAFALDDALKATGAERFRKLRVLGDGVLYVAGFFGDHIETRGVDVSYVVRVGATAYGGAADMLSRRAGAAGEENVFGELAQKFTRFVEVLAAVSEAALAHQAKDERALVRLYERWLRTGSTTLAAELGARGLVPTKGSGGVH
jgi:hypothetical protein